MIPEFKHLRAEDKSLSSILVGPFVQIVTMDNIVDKGPISDDSLEIITDSGVLIRGKGILEIGKFEELRTKCDSVFEIPYPAVLLPGLIDAHTHLCWDGSRSTEYAQRVAGSSYQEIANRGGGIAATVRTTRAASKEQLITLMQKRAKALVDIGVTTCEVKSGYGLSISEELKILEAIQATSTRQPVHIIPTCLAAHILPAEFSSAKDYLKVIVEDLFSKLYERRLTERIDVFVDEGGFSVEEARPFLQEAKSAGFHTIIHGDQFSEGGASLAAEVDALSVDHLEKVSQETCETLRDHNVIPIVLPGASMGLGIPYAPARMILDTGLPLVIASDWNPGSAPMGNLLLQAAVLGAAEKLTMAETLAGITVRAAKALPMLDRGSIVKGMRADMVIFPCKDFREVLYNQGSLKPSAVFINGECVKQRGLS